MPKSVDDLLAGGIEIPDDPAAIEALLEEEAAKAADEIEQLGKSDDPDPDKGKGGDPDKKEGDEPDKGAKPDDEAGKPDKAAETAEHAEHDKGPPQAVLRRERENRHKAETLLSERETELEEARQRIAALEAIAAKGNLQADRLQDVADKVTGDPSIKLEALDRAKLEALRQDLDDDVVDLLGKLVDQHNVLQERVERAERTNAALVQERDRSVADQQQDDIDSVPLLAVIQATRTKEADALWDRAVAYEKALQSDPDWADKSRGEVYVEVGRRLQAYLGDEAAQWLAETGDDKGGAADKGGKGSSSGKTVKDKLASARDRASPDSLSDLPAGLAAAQHEIERLEAMPLSDLEDQLNRAIDKGNLDEVISRYSSMVR